MYRFILFICLLLPGCKDDWKIEGYHYSLNLLNNSSTDVYYFFEILYPDTTISENLSIMVNNKNVYKLNSKDTKPFYTGYRVPWETQFMDASSDTLMFFILDANVVESNHWDSVKANYMILKRYDLSFDDLERMDWTIIYP